MYVHGRGVPQDFAQALIWLRKAADQDYARAQTDMGLVYEHGGPGVPQDFAQAVIWYQRAANQGYADGLTSLGWMYDLAPQGRRPGECRRAGQPGLDVRAWPGRAAGLLAI